MLVVMASTTLDIAITIITTTAAADGVPGTAADRVGLFRVETVRRIGDRSTGLVGATTAE